MSEYTREEILKMIEEAGGPGNLDLSGKDLSGIDLSKEAIAEEQKAYRASKPGEYYPPWYYYKKQGVNLLRATLKETNLSGAQLQWASLRRADLVGADLEDAQLQGAELYGANLEGALLVRADLEWTDLRRARLQGAYLAGAHLREACLRGAHLQKANLEDADLEEADLRGAHLQGAELYGANLEGADLTQAHLEKVDLSQAASLAGAYFHQVWLDQTRMTKEQLGGRIGEEIRKWYYEAKEAYLLLKNNFNQIGRYDDASWAYRKERRMERMTHRPDLAAEYYDYPKLPDPLPTGAKGIVHHIWLPFRKVGFLLRHLIRYLFDTAQLVLCDFGENPWLVLFWAAVALFVLGLVYMWSGGLGPAPGVSSAIALGDHFVYSLFAFATMDHPRIVATTGLAQFLTAFEALVGIFLAAIFVFTLGNRISRS